MPSLARASCFCWRLGGVPVGLLGGVYLAEFGGRSVPFVVRYTADMLNGVPSIVIGIFAYALVVCRETLLAFAGGVALGIMMIPIALRSTEEFLRAVPGPAGRRYGSWEQASGERSRPSWCPRPLAASSPVSMLALARVAGETAPLLFTAFGNRYWSGLESAHRFLAGDDLHLRGRAL